MFDLEKQIRAWREMLKGTMGKDAIDELECHLRDDVERLVGDGRSPQDAWEEALRRLGPPKQLSVEYAKNGARTWLAAWCAVIVLAVAVALAGWKAFPFAQHGRDVLLALHVLAITTGYTTVFAIGFVSLWATVERALGGWNQAKDAALRSAGRRLGILAVCATVIGVALGAWWAHDHMGRWWGWDIRELGGLAVAGWSMLLYRGFRAGATPTQLLVLLGVVGNIVVAMAWFWPAVGGAHSYGFPTIGMLLGGWIVLQVIALGITISPERQTSAA